MKTSRTQSVRIQSVRGYTHGLAVVLVLFAMLITGLPVLAAEAPAGATSATHPGVVNINTAGADQLKQLPRVGPALAERIMAFRESNGKFERTEDLILVQGIGEKTYEMLRTFVVVEGDTTLTRKLKTSDVPTSEAAAESRAD